MSLLQMQIPTLTVSRASILTDAWTHVGPPTTTNTGADSNSTHGTITMSSGLSIETFIQRLTSGVTQTTLLIFSGSQTPASSIFVSVDGGAASEFIEFGGLYRIGGWPFSLLDATTYQVHVTFG